VLATVAAQRQRDLDIREADAQLERDVAALGTRGGWLKADEASDDDLVETVDTRPGWLDGVYVGEMDEEDAHCDDTGALDDRNSAYGHSHLGRISFSQEERETLSLSESRMSFADTELPSSYAPKDSPLPGSSELDALRAELANPFGLSLSDVGGEHSQRASHEHLDFNEVASHSAFGHTHHAQDRVSTPTWTGNDDGTGYKRWPVNASGDLDALPADLVATELSEGGGSTGTRDSLDSPYIDTGAFSGTPRSELDILRAELADPFGLSVGDSMLPGTNHKGTSAENAFNSLK
jgi:hypothetical protein